MCHGSHSVTPVPAPRADECWRCGERMSDHIRALPIYKGRVKHCRNSRCPEYLHPVAVLDERPAVGDAGNA